MPGRISSCIRPRHSPIRAFAFDGRSLPFLLATGHEPGCRPGTLRIIRLQALVVGGKTTYVRRGGCERPAPGSPCTLQPTAHVLASDLAPIRLDVRDRNGNGGPVSSCMRTVLDSPESVGRELDRMYYKKPSELRGLRRSTAGARWSNYGDPGRRFGSASSNYLLWNLPRSRSGVLPGGGIVEAVLTQGDPVRICHVPGLSLPSFDVRGTPNGVVRFDYARVSNAREAIYGWLMRGYKYLRNPFRFTLVAGRSSRAGAR
ncbi:MAG TPA: hypothetical protein VGY97_01485 [Solirubrobacteraceae bacterium]|nr:hypothetical protein [Solirubrobacteraceae bacterium]